MQVYTDWQTFDCKPEDTLRASILKLLHTQPELAGVTEEEVTGLLQMEKLEAFYIMDEELVTFDCDGWAYTLPIRNEDKWVRLRGDELWCPTETDLDKTMEDIRNHRADTETGKFYVSSGHGGSEQDLDGMARLKVQLKAPLAEWAGDVEDFWPLTKKEWSPDTKEKMAAAEAVAVAKAEAEAEAEEAEQKAAEEAFAKNKAAFDRMSEEDQKAALEAMSPENRALYDIESSRTCIGQGCICQ